MKVCQALYDLARNQDTAHIDANIAWAGIEKATSELSAVFQSELRGLGSTPQARKLLVRLARQQSIYPSGVNASQIKRATDALVANGLIVRVSHGRCTFQEPMFQAHLIEHD